MNAISPQVIRWLPHLRRHAHALTGSRRRGDAYVMACLSILSAEPERLPPTGDVQVGLYQLFHALWRMVDREYPVIDADPAVDELVMCKGLADIPPLGREILLLVATEGFSLSEAAAITGTPKAKVASTLALARTQIRGPIDYAVPLEVYCQPRARRTVGRPSVHRHGGDPARVPQVPAGDRRAPRPAWSAPV